MSPRLAQLPELVAIDGDGARGWCCKAEHHPQRCRLAGTVRAQEAGDRPGVNAERDIVDRRGVAVALREVNDVGDDWWRRLVEWRNHAGDGTDTGLRANPRLR